MSSTWPSGFERSSTLRIATTGRKTGRRHEVTIWFVVGDGRLFISTSDNRRDWVRNLLKNPSCEVTVSKVTRKMSVVVVQSIDEEEHVRRLYRKKYRIRTLIGLLLGLYREDGIIFELKSP